MRSDDLFKGLEKLLSLISEIGDSSGEMIDKINKATYLVDNLNLPITNIEMYMAEYRNAIQYLKKFLDTNSNLFDIFWCCLEEYMSD